MSSCSVYQIRGCRRLLKFWGSFRSSHQIGWGRRLLKSESLAIFVHRVRSAVLRCVSHSFISDVEGNRDRRDPQLSSSANVCLFSIAASNSWLSASSVVSRLGAAIFTKLGKLGTFRSSRQIRGCRLLLQSRRCWALSSLFFFPLPLRVIIFRCGVSPISSCFRFHCSTFCFRYIYLFFFFGADPFSVSEEIFVVVWRLGLLVGPWLLVFADAVSRAVQLTSHVATEYRSVLWNISSGLWRFWGCLSRPHSKIKADKRM